jgi:hypothetical protein
LTSCAIHTISFPEEETRLRKLLTGAVVASATLALSGVAIAQVTNPAGNSTFDATLSPSKVGTKTKPKAHSLRTVLSVNRPGTTVETITLSLGKGFKFSGKGFKKCSEAILLSSGPSGCPAGSKVGPAGTASARLEPGNGALDFVVSPFVGDADTFLFDVDSTGIEIHSILKGEITNRGRTLTITIPKELRQPLFGIDATLTAIDATFSGKSGSNYIVSSTNCYDRRVKVSGRLGFAARQDAKPVPAPETLTEKVKCSK